MHQELQALDSNFTSSSVSELACPDDVFYPSSNVCLTRVTFKELILVKHISIFERYKLLSEVLSSSDGISKSINQLSSNSCIFGNKLDLLLERVPAFSMNRKLLVN